MKFSKEQMEWMKEHGFMSMKSDKLLLEVNDGYVEYGDQIWWKCSTGPLIVNSDSPSHKHNITNFPTVYSIEKPIGKMIWSYEDTEDVKF